MSQPPQPSRPEKPSLKVTLKLSGGGGSFSSSSPQPAMSPAPQSSASQGIPKIKFVSRSQPPTPAEQNPPSFPVPASKPTQDVAAVVPSTKNNTITTQAGRKPKPSAKKRARDDSDDDDVPLANSTPKKPGLQNKKIKIAVKSSSAGGITKQPTLKLKPVGKIPTRPLGEGYDSEAEDREVDPVIEEQLIFRMMPGEHCEYIRKAIQEKKIGIPVANGGADLAIKWLDEGEGRRAMVLVQGQAYAAILVDLPTITEGMKTWDKKAMVKTADICQMLLAFAKVDNEQEARTIPLPQTVDHGHRWPHGITPPMHDARNRRFRKRLSKLEIQNKEAEVERLLAADREAANVRIEWIDNKQTTEDVEDDEEEYEEDAEGEEDDDGQLFDDGFGELDLDESALLAEFMEAPDTPLDAQMSVEAAAGQGAETPATANTGTPAAQTEAEEADVAEEEESDEDEEDGDEEGDGDEDDDEEDHNDENAAVRAEIADLKRQLKTYEEQLTKSVQPIMRKRIEGSIRNVKAAINLKMSSIGEVDED